MAKYGQFKYNTVKYGDTAPYIFNRNLTDLLNNTDKSYINYFDLNRIENRIKELSKSLNTKYYRNNVNTKTDWEKQFSTNATYNFPLENHLSRIQTNLQTLMGIFYVYLTTPPLPENGLQNATIYNVNDIEKILYDLHRINCTIENTYSYCGDYICDGG